MTKRYNLTAKGRKAVEQLLKKEKLTAKEFIDKYRGSTKRTNDLIIVLLYLAS